MNPVILARAELSSTGNLRLKERKNFALDLPRSNSIFERVKNDLHITMNNGGKFVLKNYFVAHEIEGAFAGAPEYKKNSPLSEQDGQEYNWEHLEELADYSDDHAKNTSTS